MKNVAEYKKIDTKRVEKQITVDDYDDNGEYIGQHTETVVEEIPVMGIVYREMTSDEIAEQERIKEEMPPDEPTQADRIEAQGMYTALMTDTLLEMEE